MRDEKYSYPKCVKDHSTIGNNWVNSFFNYFDENTMPDKSPVLVDLRNKIFADKIAALDVQLSSVNIWFIVGSSHLEGLKSELSKIYNASSIEIVQRKEKC